MASDKLMNHTQGETIIDKLTSIADSLDDISAISPAKLGLGMGVCDTAASTAAKTVAIANYAITEGAPVSVQFLYANTADNATLNINNTGAKPILYKDNPLGNNVISAGDTCTFIYTTNSYRIINIDTLTGAGTGTVTQVGAENGLITDQNGNADIHHDGKIGLNLKSTTAFSSEVSAHNTSTDKMYPVALDSEGHPVAAVSNFVGSGSNHKAGLVPDTPSTAGTTKYLREDATWVEPTGDDLKLTGYEIESQAAAVAATDTINEGIGKLEYKVDANNADIQSILDGTTIDSFSDVETALSGKQATLSTAQLAAVNSGIDTTKVGQIATNTTDISSLQDAVDTKLDKTANAASAAKLNNGTTDYAVGSATKGVYFNNGVPTAMTYSVNSNVPENAVFTDTTYSSGTGITVNASNAINHSNSVTAKTTASALKVSYDAQGHITGSSALTASDVGAIATTAKGVANGVAELDSTGKVPSSQLPSYVDDVLEYSAKSSFPATGESGKIYVDTSTNKTYRWSGTTYVEISASLALGETSSTAYYGDKGKTAYEHSQVTSGNPHNVTKSDVGLGNVGNFLAVSTAANQGLSDTQKSNARANIGAGTSSLAIGTAATQAAAGNHTHGNITNAGALQSTDVSIANGDKLVVTDASDSNKIARTSAAFDGSTTTKCLTQKGTFETFGTSNLILGTTAGTAAEGNHTHTKSQITDFPSSMTPTSHTHGNIQNGGTLQTTDVTIASGDKIIVTDSSDSSKIARTSISFDGSTATQALTKKGTWETFNNYSHPTTSGNKHIPSGGSSGQILRWSADGTAAWGSDNNTWTAMVGATSSANGSVGYVNAVPPKDGYNTKYLRADGSWQVPPNTTYSNATTLVAGLMSAADKTKLDGIATGANNYTHPTSAGNKHIPSGGSSGQILVYGGSSGTAAWGSVPCSTIAASNVFIAIDSISTISDNLSSLYIQGKHLFGTIMVDFDSASAQVATIKSAYLPVDISTSYQTGMALIEKYPNQWTGAMWSLTSSNSAIILKSNTVSAGLRAMLRIDYLIA